MPHRFVPGHTRQGETAESLGDLDTGGSLIDAAGLIEFGLASVVATMAGQIVSDPHQHTPQPTIGLADERSTVMVRLIALMA